MKKHLHIPGRIENNLLIFDNADINVFNAPYKMIKTIMGTIEKLHKCLARAVFSVNTPKTFTILWGAISYIVAEVSKAKLSILS